MTPLPPDSDVENLARHLYIRHRDRGPAPGPGWAEAGSATRSTWREHARAALLWFGANSPQPEPDFEDYGKVVAQRDRLLVLARRVLAYRDPDEHGEPERNLRALVEQIDKDLDEPVDGGVMGWTFVIPPGSAPRVWEIPDEPEDVEALRDDRGNVWHRHPDKRYTWRRRPTSGTATPETTWIEREWASLLAYTGRLVEMSESPVEAALRRIEERRQHSNRLDGVDAQTWQDVVTVAEYAAQSLRETGQ